MEAAAEEDQVVVAAAIDGLCRPVRTQVDGVVAFAAQDGIAAIAAVQAVGADAAVQRVVALPARQHVGALAEDEQGIGAATAQQRVGDVVPPGQRIVARPADQAGEGRARPGIARGIAVAGDVQPQIHADADRVGGIGQPVDPAAGDDRVGPRAALQRVVAALAVEDVAGGATGQAVIALAAQQRVGKPDAPPGQHIRARAADHAVEAEAVEAVAGGIAATGKTGIQVDADARGIGGVGQPVDPAAGEDHVAARAAFQRVVAEGPVDRVVAAFAADAVGAAAGHDAVGSRARRAAGDPGADEAAGDGLVRGAADDGRHDRAPRQKRVRPGRPRLCCAGDVRDGPGTAQRSSGCDT